MTEAARNIVQGINPYAPNPQLDFFKYSPLAGLLMLPFSILPDALGTFLLLLLQAGLFIWGLARWARAAGYPLEHSVTMQWIAFFSVFLDATLAIQVGQWNVGIFGLMLLGAAQYAEGNYTRSGLVLSLGTNLKLFPFTLGLCLLTGLKRKYWGGFFGGLVLWFLLPSLLIGIQDNFRLLSQWFQLMSWDVTRNQDPMVDIVTFFSLHFGASESLRTPLAILVGLLIGAGTFYLFCKGEDQFLNRFLLPINGTLCAPVFLPERVSDVGGGQPAAFFLSACRPWRTRSIGDFLFVALGDLSGSHPRLLFQPCHTRYDTVGPWISHEDGGLRVHLGRRWGAFLEASVKKRQH